MDVTASPGILKRTLWQAFALLALLAGCYYVPPLALLLAFGLALVVCPAFVRGDAWFALALPLVPAAAFLAGGGDLYLGLMIPLCPYLCLLFIGMRHRRSTSFTGQTLLAVAAVLIAALAMILRLGRLLGSPVALGLAEYMTAQVQNSLASGSILYRLTTVGYLTVPESYRSVAGLQFGDFVLLNPLLQRELVNMLRLRLVEGFAVWLPSLLMQGGIALGLFTAFFTARARAARPGSQGTAPLFRTLHLPRKEQRYMLFLCILVVLTSFSAHPFFSLVCSLAYAAFMAIYQLLGAAVMIFMLSRRHPERIPLYAAIAALLYLLFPLALFLLGMADQFIHFRATSLSQHEEE
ncbi:MAG: hypothetical protein VB087_10675 [Candidatus Limiplasma sp.]|nr:hypothetical protein [Candidatus Limiplasma sp.]